VYFFLTDTFIGNIKSLGVRKFCPNSKFPDRSSFGFTRFDCSEKRKFQQICTFFLDKKDEGTKLVLEKYFQPVYVKFHVDNETLSKVKFDILSSNYKLSLLKERIESGKYFCNNDQSNTMNNTNSNSYNNSAIADLQVPSSADKKNPMAGSLSTSIGSTVDVLLNN
jgi:hypothetical protein